MWQKLSKEMPKSPTSAVAQAGTAMHWLFAESLEDYEFDPADYIGKHVEGVEMTDEMILGKVYTAVDMVDELIGEYSLTTVHTEVLMELSEEVGGSADVIAWGENVFLMGDLKTGDGKIVQAKNNAQLLFYTMLAIEHFADVFDFNDSTLFLLAIFQPTERRGDPLDVWTTSLRTVRTFRDAFMRAYLESKAETGHPTAGAHCAYCPAVAVCPAKTGVAQASLRIKVDSQNMRALNDGMAIVDAVESWCRDIRKLAHDQAEQGVKIDGWKLVNKRASRVWNDAPAVELKLKHMRKLIAADYYTQKLLTAPALEKVCKAKKVDFAQFKRFISSVSSGTTLAHDSDPRPEALAINALQQIAARIN
jgi:hypothetical protein